MMKNLFEQSRSHWVRYDHYELILLYLSRFCEGCKFPEATEFYAWKGYDFDILNDLWDKDYIRQGSHPSRTKRVYLTESGLEYARKLLEKYGISDWK